MFKFFKKGQAAMDLLLTYGWVLVVIIGIIAVLIGSDLLDPSSQVPETCILESGGIKCVADDFNFVSADPGGSVSLTLINQNPASSVTINGLEVKLENATSWITCPNSSHVNGTNFTTLGKGKSAAVVFNGTGCAFDNTTAPVGEKNSYDIKINVTSASGLPREARGTLKVSPSES